MNIALIGYGSMGQEVKRLAEERGHTVSLIVDPEASLATVASIDDASFDGIDVAIEFSNPESVMSNIDTLINAGIPTVIGTTGWYDHLDAVRKKVEAAGTGMLWSFNFSVGVNLYFRIIKAAAKLINRFDEYDVWGNEIHHNRKADSPSGTAKTIEQILLKEIDRKTAVVEEKLDRKIEPNEIHFSSTRGGPVNFAHTIGFDSAADTITISHVARNRSGYALGSIKTAEWMEKKTGFYTMDDFLRATIS